MGGVATKPSCWSQSTGKPSHRVLVNVRGSPFQLTCVAQCNVEPLLLAARARNPEFRKHHIVTLMAPYVS